MNRRRPFVAKRLKEVIKQLPVTANSEESSKGSEWEIPLGNAAKKVKSPMGKVIRSKGCVLLFVCACTCVCVRACACVCVFLLV